MSADDMTPLGAVRQVQAIAAILVAFSEAPLDRGDPGAALQWLAYKLDEAGAVLAVEVKP